LTIFSRHQDPGDAHVWGQVKRFRDEEYCFAGRDRAFAVELAAATLDGIEVVHMIRKDQITPGLYPFKQFSELAA